MTMELTHINSQGRAKMVDVSDKPETFRTAVAEGTVRMSPATAERIRTGGIAKGDVLAVAQVAGIMAAKRTGDWVPMCHPVRLTGVDLSFTVEEAAVRIRAEARCKGETGVEMEALTAVSAAALTIYDMCKAIQKDMEICGVRLCRKTGGRSGEYEKEW